MLKNLPLNEKAYIIGLFQGDGSLCSFSRNRGKLSYEISIRDISIINKLNKILSNFTNVYIRERIRDTNFKKSYHSVILTIYNLSFRKAINKYIPYGKKSSTIKYNMSLISKDFIRGLTDSDGSIGLTTDNRCFWSLCTASENIKNFVLNDIKQFLNFEKRLTRNKRDGVYNIVLYDEDAQKYTKRLYKNSTIHINKKYNSYLLIQKWVRIKIKSLTRKKTWLKWENEIVLSHCYTLEEKIQLLNRTDKSIKMKLWRLNNKPSTIVKG